MRRILIAAALAAIVLGGCGSGERVFGGQELIDRLNDEGAGLVLGPELETIGTGSEVNQLAFVGGSDDGALTIVGSADEARSELARCDSAISFTCFRVANAVIRFEGMSDPEQARLSLAMMALQEG